MKLFWKVYSLLFLVIVWSNLYQLFSKDSPFAVYYNTTIILSSWLAIPYFFNILNVLTACIVCLFVFAFAFDIRTMALVPVWFFYARILIDCVGHSYEFKMIQAGFTHGNSWGCIALASLILPVLPSYLALWKLTFKIK